MLEFRSGLPLLGTFNLKSSAVKNSEFFPKSVSRKKVSRGGALLLLGFNNSSYLI